jgi:hypothetical protein
VKLLRASHMVLLKKVSPTKVTPGKKWIEVTISKGRREARNLKPGLARIKAKPPEGPGPDPGLTLGAGIHHQALAVD